MPPPLDLQTIEDLGMDLDSQDPKAAQAKLAQTAESFKGRGDARSWTEALLGKIDKCFLDNYCDSAGDPCDSLFFPNNADNFNRFTRYCSDVDKVFQEQAVDAPPYAREYFSYAMIWKIHGYKFPIPLGTASVIGAFHHLATKYKDGLREVSRVPFPVS